MSLQSVHTTAKTILLLPPRLWIRRLYKYEFFALFHTLRKENVWTLLIWDNRYLINCCSLIFVQRFHYLLFAVCFLLYIKYFVMKTYAKPGIGTPCLWHFFPLLYNVLCWQTCSVFCFKCSYILPTKWHFKFGP